MPDACVVAADEATVRKPALAVEALTVTYPYRQRPAIGPATLNVEPGERLLLLGASGAGKSTLLSAATGLVPAAIPALVEGTARLFGEDARGRRPADWNGIVARLFQNPEETLCGMTVQDEVSFSLENRAMPEALILERVDDALKSVGIPSRQRLRRTSTLSGGEKQLVALAALIAQDAPLAVVDEPTANLAPLAAARLRELVLSRRQDRAVVIVDHRLDGLVDAVDRVVVVDGRGSLLDGGPPRSAFRLLRDTLSAQGIWMPLASRIDGELIDAGILVSPAPLSLEELFAAVDRLPEKPRKAAEAVISAVAARVVSPGGQPGGPLMRLEQADCAPMFGPTVLRDISVAIHRGETVAIVGRNGAGKTTLAASIAGLLKLRKGTRTGPPGGIAFQNPENQFTQGNVRDEILSSLGGEADRRADTATRTMEEWNLAGLDSVHPYELSHGQKRRLALATLTAAAKFDLLVLDEPTAGLDAAGSARLASSIHDLSRQGYAIVVVTHDLDFALRTCARSIIVDRGGIALDGPSAHVLRNATRLREAGLEPPPAARLLDWLEGMG